MISEGSCDTGESGDVAENSALANYFLQYLFF